MGKYIYGPGIDESICRIYASGETMFYYHFDGLGSVVALSDENADVVEKYSYDVYGKPMIRGPGDELVLRGASKKSGAFVVDMV